MPEAESRKKKRSAPETFIVAGIGASAGGLEAFTEFLQKVPANTGMAYVLIQHLDPRHESILAELLASKTSMPVIQISGVTLVEPDHVYVTPPNSVVLISGRTLHLELRVPGSAGNYPIDTFFKSLAEDLGPNSIGVVLSGTASDGTFGLKAIKHEGGITFAQDGSAQFDSMPRNAIAAGVVDFILSPARIAEELSLISGYAHRKGESELDDLQPGPALQRILMLVRSNTGVDFTQYKQPTIVRRVQRRMMMRKVQSVEQYAAVLQEDPGEAGCLFNDLLINVTDFFRDPQVFDVIRKNFFPALLKDRNEFGPIRIWVPGCSTGEEVYSIAILLIEFLQTHGAAIPVQIFGTDISRGAIEKARSGIYEESSLGNVSAERRRTFFSRADSGYQISRAVRDSCIFSSHNLAKDPPLSRMDLISCRNLLIYFSPILQRRVISTFAYSLHPRGCLVLGTSESLGGMSDCFDTIDDQNKIYSRKASLPPSALNLSDRVEGYTPPGAPLSGAPPVNGGQPSARFEPAEKDQDDTAAHNGEPLERQLANTRHYLRSIIEVLRSTNEQAQSANEELQSTNEELQTAKEELQSSNEELHTINAEMQSRNCDLTQTNDDLVNLLSAMNMPIIMLGNDLRIRRYTPVASKVLHLIPSDIGRPISDLKPRIDVPNLEEILSGVLETLIPDEREVRDTDGHWYLMRIRPYRTSDNRIEGAVMQLLDVGELKKSLDDVRNARDYAQAIVDSVREPLVVLDSRFAIRNGNSAFHEFAGVPAAAARGLLIFDIAHRTFDSPGVRNLLGQMASGGNQVRDLEIEYLAAGEKRVMVLNARYLRESAGGLILLSFEDITERKRAAEARYRRLFEAARDGIVILDAATGVVTDINPFLERLSSYTRDEIVGRKLWDLAFIRDEPGLRPALEKLGERGSFTFPELTLWTKNGETRQTEAVVNAYTDGDRRSIQLNIRDLTDRRKFEREVQHGQKLESLGLLAGGIAHDFNNLLTGILGNASLVYSEVPVDHPARKQLREIIGASERAAFLTKQLLAYAGQGRFAMQNLDAGELAREAAAMVAPSIPGPVELAMNLPDGLPPLQADPGQIQQLLISLITNAAEAIGEGRKGLVGISAEVVNLSREEAQVQFPIENLAPGRYLKFEVKDNGSGMDAATVTRIFDPFFTTKFKGRGLGLAAALGVARGHKGGIRVYSQPGAGSTFQIWLPAAKGGPVSIARQDGTDSANEGAGGQSSGDIALVIDDEAMVRDVAAQILARRGFQVLQAAGGEEGVELFRQHRDKIKVVMLDLLMPGIDGRETLARLREIRCDIPVVIASGLDVDGPGQRAPGPEPVEFLQKPYRAAALMEAVNKAMQGMKDAGR